MIENPVLGIAPPLGQKNNILLQVNDSDFQQQISGSIFTKTSKRSPINSTKNTKSAIKFVAEVSQPKIDLRRPLELTQKVVEVNKIRQESMRRKIQRISPA